MIIGVSTNLNDIIEKRQLRRLTYLELYAYVFGQVNRRALMERFEVKEALASRDIKAYLELASNNLIYEPSKKAYVSTPWFAPYFDHSFEEAANLVANGTVLIECTKPSACGAIKVASFYEQLNLDKLRPLLVGISLRAIVDVEYESYSSGKTRRTVKPHTLFESGAHWYIRAYDFSVDDFRTFRLDRFISTNTTMKTSDKGSAESDNDWHQEVSLRIVNNAKVEPNNDETCELLKGERVLKIPIAMEMLVLKELGIAPFQYDGLPSELFPLKVIDRLLLSNERNDKSAQS